MRTGSGWVNKGISGTVGARVLAVFSRLPLSWSGLGALVVGALLARWTWILFAPHTLAVLPPKPEVTGAAAESLFGAVAASGVAAATGGSTIPGVKLIGVFAGKHGFAVLRLDEKRQLGVALGEEVAPGTKLVEVAADHVLLEHNGLRQRVNLEDKFADSKGLTVERAALSATPNAARAMAEWNQARQEMQKERELPLPRPQ